MRLCLTLYDTYRFQTSMAVLRPFQLLERSILIECVKSNHIRRISIDSLNAFAVFPESYHTVARLIM